MSIKESFRAYIHSLQDEICSRLEETDGKRRFEEDKWERPGGGGGRTRVIRDGDVFEKGGVNISEVHGTLPPLLQEKLKVDSNRFYACGLSLVLHPNNPIIPTTHANFRYFEMYDENGNRCDGWFGGGIDMTPYYIKEEDVVHFHRSLKTVCDQHHQELYPKFKQECDTYFFNAHRQEARGIGGIFFDYLKSEDHQKMESWMRFTMDCGKQFLPSYLPIVKKRKAAPFSEAQKIWQEIRRGRYVEFNLIHDKGTLFGLKTDGRTESILMSLPPKVRWEYNHIPAAGSEEQKLLDALQPKDWASLNVSL
jgi:coproporphyrinogen III oxidase